MIYKIVLLPGKKEAKLLNKSKNKSKELLELKTVDQPDVHEINKELNNELNEKLNNPINNHLNKLGKPKSTEKLEKEFEKFKFDEKNAELTKDANLNEWRSIDQIKKEFEDLNIKLTTDSENVHQLLDRYRKTNSDAEKITILKDLEFILHQYDVSKDFIKMNGLDVLKDDFRNNQNGEIQGLISVVLGSAASGNPTVKVAIIKVGLFDDLITKLAEEKDLKLSLKTIFAISSILRQFPYAQQQFVEKNGLTIFKQFFNDSSTNLKNSNTTNLTKMQTKIISLLSDLMDEYKFTFDEFNALSNTTGQSNELNNLEEKMKQYNQVALEQHFLKEGFCLIIPRNLNSTSYDVKEKVLKSMYSFRSVCKDDFKPHLDNLIRIRQELEQKIANDKLNEESDDDYYQNLVKLTQTLIDSLID